MSYCTWINYGYGVETPTNPITFENLKKFLGNHKVVKEWIQDVIENEVVDEDITIIDDYEGKDCECCGIASMLKDVIQDEDNIRLVACDDYDGRYFLIFTPRYPWDDMTDEEKIIKTQDDIKNLISPYLVELYGEKYMPEFEYKEVENGG